MIHTDENGCYNCGSGKVVIFFDARYNGFRGFCDLCDNNWPES